MYRRKTYLLSLIVLTVSGLLVAGAAVAQQNRIREYQSKLEKQIAKEVEAFRSTRLEQRRGTLASMTPENGARPRALPKPQPDPNMAEERRAELEKSIESFERPFKSVVNVSESKDGKGQDVEIRLTMPIDAFMEFAPIAALEAAAVLHKFEVVNIYLREETTDRVARVAFRDAEPIAGRYLAGDEAAVSEMNEIIIWH